MNLKSRHKMESREIKHNKQINRIVKFRFNLWNGWDRKINNGKGFKKECEYKWQCDDQKKVMHVKSDDEGFDVCEKVEDNEILNNYRHSSQVQYANVNCAGTIRVFSNLILRIIEKYIHYSSAEQTQEELNALKKEIIGTTKYDESTHDTDASWKEGKMEGTCEIEDNYDIVSGKHSVSSKK